MLHRLEPNSRQPPPWFGPGPPLSAWRFLLSTVVQTAPIRLSHFAIERECVPDSRRRHVIELDPWPPRLQLGAELRETAECRFRTKGRPCLRSRLRQISRRQEAPPPVL